jgi:hypothetical protein
MPLRARTKALWDFLHARGRLRSADARTAGRSGFEIASGS